MKAQNRISGLLVPETNGKHSAAAASPKKRSPSTRGTSSSHQVSQRRANRRTLPKASDAAPPLPAEDMRHLASFEKLRHLLGDRARSVALGYQNGAYIAGPPGCSKTYTVIQELEAIDANYILKNAKMTASGLFDLLQSNPEKTIVLDDIPSLFAERSALAILLAALGGKPGEPRLITYTSAEVEKGRRSFEFRGGIIGISNVSLRNDPLAGAVGSRVSRLSHDPTDDMLVAFMRATANQGYKDVTPADARGVIEFTIAELKAAELRMDLRVMPKALEDFRLWKDGRSRLPWQDLVRSSLKQFFAVYASPVTRQGTKDKEERVAADLFKKFPGRNQVVVRNSEWEKATGKSIDTLLRYGRSLKGARAI